MNKGWIYNAIGLSSLLDLYVSPLKVEYPKPWGLIPYAGPKGSVAKSSEPAKRPPSFTGSESELLPTSSGPHFSSLLQLVRMDGWMDPANFSYSPALCEA